MEKIDKDKKRYQHGKIYSIRSHQTEGVYIGSTINTLPKRLYKHKKDCEYWINGKKNYVSSFEIIKYDDCYIELIENYPCNDRNELERQEGTHIRNTDCINKNVAGRTQKERYNDNHDRILKQKKQYDNDNRDKKLQQMKEYRAKNKELISQKGKARYQAKKLAKLNNQSII